MKIPFFTLITSLLLIQTAGADPLFDVRVNACRFAMKNGSRAKYFSEIQNIALQEVESKIGPVPTLDTNTGKAIFDEVESLRQKGIRCELCVRKLPDGTFVKIQSKASATNGPHTLYVTSFDILPNMSPDTIRAIFDFRILELKRSVNFDLISGSSRTPEHFAKMKSLQNYSEIRSSLNSWKRGNPFYFKSAEITSNFEMEGVLNLKVGGAKIRVTASIYADADHPIRIVFHGVTAAELEKAIQSSESKAAFQNLKNAFDMHEEVDGDAISMIFTNKDFLVRQAIDTALEFGWFYIAPTSV